MASSLTIGLLLVVASCAGDRKPPRTGTGSAPDNPQTTPAAPAAIDPTYVDIVEVGGDSTRPNGTCALRRDGRVACWGESTTYATAKADFLPGVFDAIAVEGTQYGIRILRRDHTVLDHGIGVAPPDRKLDLADVAQLASSCVRFASGGVKCESAARWLPPPVSVEASDLAGIGASACAVNGGDVTCWGNDLQALGSGAVAVPGYDQYAPASYAVTKFGDAIEVAVSNYRTCALRRTGAVTCWGDVDGRSGASAGDRPPVTVAIPPARSLRGSINATCAITNDRDAYCWGSFQHPAAGDGKAGPHPPTKLPLHDVVAVTPEVTCAITGDGTSATCWAPRYGCDATTCFETYRVALP